MPHWRSPERSARLSGRGDASPYQTRPPADVHRRCRTLARLGPARRPPRCGRCREFDFQRRRAARLRVRRLRDRQERARRGRVPDLDRAGRGRGPGVQPPRRPVRPEGGRDEPGGRDVGRRRRRHDLPHADEAHPGDQPGGPLRGGRAGGRERVAHAGAGGLGVPLRPRPVEPGGLHHRRERRHELRRAAHAEIRGDGQPRPRPGIGLARRRGRDRGRPLRGFAGVRPGRARGGERGDVRDRHEGGREPRARPRGRAGPSSACSRPWTPPPRRSRG